MATTFCKLLGGRNLSSKKLCQHQKSLLKLRSLREKEHFSWPLSHYPVDDKIFGLSETEVALLETIFNFCQKEIAPHASSIDKENGFPDEKRAILWKKLGDMGLFGITASSEYGGSDMTYFDQCIVVEEMTQARPAMCMNYLAQ